MSSRDLNDLLPPARKRARALVAAAREAGIELLITSTLRTFEEQAELYSRGRRGIPGEKWVTKAKPGQSWHNYGLAFDVVPLVNGKAIWNSPHWARIGELGEMCGLAWGGRWRRFRDLPHFEYRPHLSLREALDRHDKGEPLFTRAELEKWG